MPLDVSLARALSLSLFSSPSLPPSAECDATRACALLQPEEDVQPLTHPHLIRSAGRPGPARPNTQPLRVNSEWGRGGVRVKGFALCQFFMFVRGGSRAYTSKRVAGKGGERKKKKTYSKLFLAAFTSKSLAGVPTVGVPPCCLCGFIIRAVQSPPKKKKNFF